MASWLGWGASVADEPIDRATSELLPAGTEDIALNLEICDQIRSKTIPAKDAVRALKRRLNHKNPNVQLLTLGLTDVCIKNGGDHFLVEIASRDFMDNLVSILKMPGLNMDVKNKILRHVQNWALSFEAKPVLHYVPQVYKELKSEGFNFPPKDPSAISSAMVDTKTAPEWIDSDVCLRCRTPFTFTNRKHHCRNCGQVFDQQCSSKSLPLPHFGIAQEVRVCDSCHAKLTRQRTKSQGGEHKSHSHRHRPAREYEDAELQRAIQLSLQEVGAVTGGHRPGYVPYQPSSPPWQPSEPPVVDRAARLNTDGAAGEEDDPDLRAAIEASLREASAPRPSAPSGMDTPRADVTSFDYSRTAAPALPSVPALPNYDLEPLESDTILTFNQTVEQIQAQNRPDMARYPAVNDLYNKAASLSPKLTRSMEDTDRREQLLDDMHNKLSEAVKLYDHLLTQRVSQPARRSQASYAPPYQQPAQGHSSVYNQWQPTSAAQPSYVPQIAQAQASTSTGYPLQMYGQYSGPVSAHSPEPESGYQTSFAPISLPQSPVYGGAPVSIPQLQPASAAPASPAVSFNAPQAPAQPQSPLPQRHVIASPPPAASYRPHVQQYDQPVQQVQPPASAPAPTMPNFPVAPTLPPTSFSLNEASPIPAGIAQPDRKEALLIDL